MAYLVLCAAIGISSFWRPRSVTDTPAMEHAVVWPSSWQGKRLVPIPADPGSSRFLEQFSRSLPGICLLRPEVDGVLTGSGERILLRCTSHPTRQLHPAKDCFRGADYAITPLPLRVDPQGRRWSSFVGLKGGERVMVWQCLLAVPDPNLKKMGISIADRASWPDASSWYWDMLTRDEAVDVATLAITIIG